MAKYCGRCESRTATHKANELPEVVQPDVADLDALCDDCWGEMEARAEILASA